MESLSSSISSILNETETTIEELVLKPELQYKSFLFNEVDKNMDVSHMPPANEATKTLFYDEFFAKYMNKPYITSVYMGTAEGALYLSPLPSSEVNLNEYDPRSRSWYELAVASPGKIIWTEPYLDVTTGNSTLAFARTVEDDKGNIIGVVGIDFNLNYFAHMVRDNIKWNTIYIIIGFFTVGMVLIFFFVKTLTNRIFLLRNGMAQLQQGDYTHRIEVKGKRFIKYLLWSIK